MLEGRTTQTSAQYASEALQITRPLSCVAGRMAGSCNKARAGGRHVRNMRSTASEVST